VTSMTSTLSKAAMVGAFVLCCGMPFAQAITGQKLTRVTCDLPEFTDVARSRGTTETLAFALWGASVAPLTRRLSLRLRGGEAQQNRQSSRSHSPPRSCESFSELATSFGSLEQLGVKNLAQDFVAERKNGSSDEMLNSDRLNNARRYKLSRTVEI